MDTFISDSSTNRVTNNGADCNVYGCCDDDQNDDCDVQEDEDNDIEDDCGLGNPPPSLLRTATSKVFVFEMMPTDWAVASY